MMMAVAFFYDEIMQICGDTPQNGKKIAEKTNL